MESLSPEEKSIILNFYFRCGTEEEILKGRDLIASDERAARLYSSLENTLSSLDHVKYEPCPDNLAELTITRLKNAANTKQSPELTELLEAEQDRDTGTIKIGPSKSGFWRNFSEVAAIAAMVLFALGIGFPTLSNARQRAWKQQCAANLGRVGVGLAAYSGDYENSLPHLSSHDGQPWWKIGFQGDQTQSNTRHYWLLVKQGYNNTKDFLCPARKDSEPIDEEITPIVQLEDFPSRKNISYSFMLVCDPLQQRVRSGKVTIFMADTNPIFEKVYDNQQPLNMSRDEFDQIALNEKMRSMMSRNHSGRGQNILMSAGNAAFKDKRVLLEDDIYTVRNTMTYKGRETPCNPDDFFLVP